MTNTIFFKHGPEGLNTPHVDDEPLLSETTLAGHLGVTAYRVAKLRETGLIVPALVIGNRRFYLPADAAEAAKQTAAQNFVANAMSL
jgi:hypothetical protein